MKAEVIKDRYVIEKQIGKGGMSEVFLCKDLLLNTYWAGKRIWKNDKEESYLAYSALKKETEMIVHLKHKSIPKIIDCLDTVESYIVIMELINGLSLHQKVLKEPISESDILKWAKSILEILHYLHHEIEKPIVFRDLKPENLLVKDNGEIMLIDFGIALYLDGDKVNNEPCLGTRGYASKEQSAPGYIDCRSDYYGFGATLFFLYSKKVYHKQTIPKVGLQDVIEKCLQDDVQKRYQNVDEILQDITKCKVKKHKVGKLIFISFIFFLFNIYANNQYQKLLDEQYFNYINNKEYEQAILLNSSKIDAYLYYYAACKKDGIPYALQKMNNLSFNDLSSKDHDQILNELAFDCFLMEQVDYYQLAATYLRQIKHKDVSIYIRLCDLMGNHKELSYGNLEEFTNLLLELENEIDAYETVKQKLQFYKILLQSYTSQLEALGYKAYENVLRIAKKGVALTIYEDRESTLYEYQIYFCEKEILTYIDFARFLQMQGQGDSAQQYIDEMLVLFHKYDQKGILESSYINDKVSRIRKDD